MQLNHPFVRSANNRWAQSNQQMKLPIINQSWHSLILKWLLCHVKASYRLFLMCKDFVWGKKTFFRRCFSLSLCSCKHSLAGGANTGMIIVSTVQLLICVNICIIRPFGSICDRSLGIIWESCISRILSCLMDWELKIHKMQVMWWGMQWWSLIIQSFYMSRRFRVNVDKVYLCLMNKWWHEGSFCNLSQRPAEAGYRRLNWTVGKWS